MSLFDSYSISLSRIFVFALDSFNEDGNKTSRSELSVYFSDSFVVNPCPQNLWQDI